MKKIIYTRADGGMSVMGPCEGARLALGVTLPDGQVITDSVPRPIDTFLRRWPVEGATADWAETESAFIARIIDKDVPKDATDVQIVGGNDIPADRVFRNAWKSELGGVGVDMPKALEIHRNKLRELRAPKLAALDVEYMRALEQSDGAKMATIAAKKQALRDVTADPALIAAQTPEELKAAIPEALR